MTEPDEPCPCSSGKKYKECCGKGDKEKVCSCGSGKPAKECCEA